MLLERLVETTGKTLLLQHPDWVVVQMQQSVRQMLDPSVVRRATHVSDAAAQQCFILPTRRSPTSCTGTVKFKPDGKDLQRQQRDELGRPWGAAAGPLSGYRWQADHLAPHAAAFR